MKRLPSVVYGSHFITLWSHLHHLKVPVIIWWLNMAVLFKQNWSIVIPSPQFRLTAFPTGLSSMFSCYRRHLSGDMNHGEEHSVLFGAAFIRSVSHSLIHSVSHSVIHSFIQSFSRRVKVLCPYEISDPVLLFLHECKAWCLPSERSGLCGRTCRVNLTDLPAHRGYLEQPGEDLVTELSARRSRQRALHLLKLQRAPVPDVAHAGSRRRQWWEAGEEGQARLGRSLQAAHLAFTPQKLEGTRRV